MEFQWALDGISIGYLSGLWSLPMTATRFGAASMTVCKGFWVALLIEKNKFRTYRAQRHPQGPMSDMIASPLRGWGWNEVGE